MNEYEKPILRLNRQHWKVGNAKTECSGTKEISHLYRLILILRLIIRWSFGGRSWLLSNLPFVGLALTLITFSCIVAKNYLLILNAYLHLKSLLELGDILDPGHGALKNKRDFFLEMFTYSSGRVFHWFQPIWKTDLSVIYHNYCR